MAVPPLHESLVEIHESLTELGQIWSGSIDVNQDRTEIRRGLDPMPDVAVEIRPRDRYAIGHEMS